MEKESQITTPESIDGMKSVIEKALPIFDELKNSLQTLLKLAENEDEPEPEPQPDPGGSDGDEVEGKLYSVLQNATNKLKGE